MEYKILILNENFSRVCRMCLEAGGENDLISIFDYKTKFQIHEIIKGFLPNLELIEGDLLPQNICRLCYCKFVDFRGFLDNCLEINNNLCTYFNNMDCVDKKEVSKVEFLDSNGNEQTFPVLNEELTQNEEKDENKSFLQERTDAFQHVHYDILEVNSENGENFERNEGQDNLDQEQNCLESNSITNIEKYDTVSDVDYQTIGSENLSLFDCEYCNYAVADDHLQEHIAEYHPPENPFLCTKCFRNFRIQNIRDKHILLNMCQVDEEKLRKFQSNAAEILLTEHNDLIEEDLQAEGNEDFDGRNEIILSDIENTNVFSNGSEERTIDEKYIDERTVDDISKSNDTIIMDSLLKCSICEEEFQKRKALMEHISRWHPTVVNKTVKSKYLCEICGKDCKSKQSLESHLNYHKGIKPYLCDICTASFYGSKALRNHVTNEHTSDKYLCELCNKIFTKRTIYLNHLSYHKKNTDPNRKPDIKYKCQFCPRTFNTVSTLKIHSLTHKKLLDSKHICTECHVTFKRADHLKMHIYGVHLNHKPFPCEHCEKSFSTAWQRNTHFKKYHSTEKKRYKCDTCPNEYASVSSLKRHIIIHTRELKYKCDICDMKFQQIFMLEEHLRTHDIDEKQRQDLVHDVYMEIAKSVIISN